MPDLSSGVDPTPQPPTVHTCVLCGHTAPGDHSYLGGMVAGMYLCHQDDHSCYGRWTIHGERPAAVSVPVGPTYPCECNPVDDVQRPCDRQREACWYVSEFEMSGMTQEQLNGPLEAPMYPVPVGHDNPADDLVEIAAKAIFEVEYPRYSPDASADSNRWSWAGDGTRETLRDECRAYGAAVLAAVVPVLEKQLRTENERLARDRDHAERLHKLAEDEIETLKADRDEADRVCGVTGEKLGLVRGQRDQAEARLRSVADYCEQAVEANRPPHAINSEVLWLAEAVLGAVRGTTTTGDEK